MKEKKNKKGLRSLLAGLLALVLALSPVLSALPALEVSAAAEPVVWWHLTSGENNGNAHTYSDAGTKPAAFWMNKSATMPLNGQISAKVKFVDPETARFAIFYTYQDDDHWIYIGYDKSSKWYYQYKNGSEESYPGLEGLPTPEAGKEYDISISLTNEALQVNMREGTNEYSSKGSVPALKTLAEAIDGAGRFGFRAGTSGSQYTDVLFRDVAYTGQDSTEDEWGFLVDGLGSACVSETVRTFTVSGKVTDTKGDAIAGANVRLSTESTVTDDEGNYVIEGIEAGTYTMSVSATSEYEAVTKEVTVTDSDVAVETIRLPAKTVVTYDTYIASSEMKAAIDEDFPRVMQYEMLSGTAKGKMFKGQEDAVTTIQINGNSITPQLTSFKKNDDNAVYQMKLVDKANSIDLDMEVTIRVSENNLTWEVTEITKNAGCVKINTINVPKLNLITIDDSQTDAQFKGAVNSGNVNSSGDREITFQSGFTANNTGTYGYGFLSGNGLSAGLWSNSEALGDRRVTRNNGSNTISLTSSAWYYEYGNDAASANYENTPVSELPCTKVCITPDLNDDGVADWQDGAIAYRDIMNNPYGSENVPELVNYRIVMNLGSLGPNPFMKNADNVKKVYLATDGLGQAIMLKGYGNEGHDSANSEYGGIAERLGGLEDLKKLNTIAHQYNTQVGIHVNANEAYPEAQTFSEDLIVPSQIMNPTTWGWMDKSYEINKIYDLGSGLRYKRFLQLYDQLNDTALYANKWPGVAGQGEDETVADAETISSVVAENIDNAEDLDFIYLDVWYQDSWETRKIAQQINSLGWRFSTEFGTSGEYDSTWQHWATEGHYGGSTSKGNNSEVMRFIRNHQRDSFVLNYPSFGGTADNPLLGHLGLSGFEGWGSSNDSYNDYIVQTFTENLPAKFLQHYLITKWVDYTGENGDVSPVGNQEKEITLKSSDGADTVVVTRNEEQRSDNYVERTITLNGTKVLDDVTYLLPWEDSETKEEKLYHWNYDGGTTTWELLDDWKSLKNVVVYELSDQGRGEGRTVEVVNGQITLTAAAKTAYVVTKGEEAPKELKADFGEGAYVTDPGFNTYAGTGAGTALNGEVWSGDIDDSSIYVKKVSTGNQYLMFDSPSKDVAVSTQLNSLIPGQEYVAEIYVDNRSDVKAGIEISGAVQTVSNYSLRSLAQNYNQADAHSTRAVSGSRMQEMQVSFTAASNTATLTLTREAGEGITHFDDIRIVPKAVYNFREDGTFVQDFESVVQGYYPFVLGSAQGVTDPVTHLSELHEPYTQSGWGSRILDDVISGSWSLKHHGANYGIIYQTIPQNYHFEAGKTYEISFDYQSGSANSYCIAIGDETGDLSLLPYMEKTTTSVIGEKSYTKTFTFTLTGAESGQSWFGLYSNGQQESGELGQRDFIMDNLVIKEAEGTVANLVLDKDTITLKGVNGTETINAVVEGDDAAKISYASSNDGIAVVDENGVVTPVAYGETTITVTAKAAGTILVSSVNVTVARSGKENCQYTRVYANSEETSSESGGRNNTVDGNSSTLWHTNYSTAPFTVSESNPAILTYELASGETLNTLRFQQRATGGSNGLIKKYQFVWGTTFDSSTHTVSGGASSAVITVPAGQVKNSEWIEVDISGVDMSTVKYLQIRILEGYNGFGAMAEFDAYKYEEYSGKEPSADAVDKAGLAAAVKDLANINTFGLSAEDIQKRNDAVAEAEKVLVSAGTTEEVAAAELEKINSIKAALTSGKKEELARLIKEYETLDTGEFTTYSVTIFENALKQAKQAVESESAFDVNNALYVLQTSYGDLTKKSGGKIDEEEPIDPEVEALKKELSQELSDAKAKNSKDYTADSFAALQTAIDNAEKILADENATKVQLQNAKDAVAKAVAGLKAAVPVTPVPPVQPEDSLRAGDTRVVGNVQYKVINAAKKTVAAVKGTKKRAASVKIADTVTIKNVKCKVVQINAKAFRNYTRLSKVTIGKNVKTIGKNSFYGCRKLTKVTFRGTAVKTIKAGAFKKTGSKMTVSVPKAIKKNSKKANAFKKKLTKAGMIKKLKLK